MGSGTPCIRIILYLDEHVVAHHDTKAPCPPLSFLFPFPALYLFRVPKRMCRTCYGEHHQPCVWNSTRHASAPHSQNSFDATPTNVARRQPSFSRSSWKNSLAAAAEEERQQAAEARGSGYYSLHAVIGQGSFGRIHLTSWRTEEEQSALLSSPPPVSSSSIERRSTDPARATRPCRGAGRSRTESAGSIREISTLPSYASDGRLGSPDRRGNPGRQTSSNDAALNVAGLGRAGSRRGDGPSLPSHSRRHSENSETLDTRCYEPERMFDDEREWVGNERWEDGHGEEEPDPRLRALKSVCKRKVTEKGLVRHVETVSHC